MCEIVNKLLKFMEPYVKRIEEEKNSLEEKNKYLTEINDLVKYINNEPKNIFNYGNQEIVINMLTNVKSNISEYKAFQYILNSKVEEVYMLPQYSLANDYINDFYEYIKRFSKHIDLEYRALLKGYQNHELIYKYYEMFKNDDVFVNDIDEFKLMLDNFVFTISEKIKLILFIIQENNKRFFNTPLVKEKKETYNLLKFQEVMNKNKNLLTSQYNELLNIVSEYVDLTKEVNEIVDYELINKINVNNILLAKKIWLMKKIDLNYQNSQYDKVKDLVNKFETVSELLNKVREIKDKKEAIKIIKGAC